MSKQPKVKKPHGIRHSIGLFFSVLLLVLGIGLNIAWGMFGPLAETFMGAASPQVSEEDKVCRCGTGPSGGGGGRGVGAQPGQHPAPVR